MPIAPTRFVTRAGTAVGWVLVLVHCCPFPASGHAPVAESVEAVSTLIRQEPGNPAFYLQRAELQRRNGDLRAAGEDLRVASELGANPLPLALCRATLDLDRQRPAAAIKWLDEVIQEVPGDAHAYRLRARARSALGDLEGAITDLTCVLDRSPDPESYLLRARLQSAGGTVGTPSAIVGLEEGIERLGPVIPLVLAIVDLESDLGRLDDALGHLSLLDRRRGSHAGVLIRRGEILRRAGRLLESLSCYTEALASIEELPPERRVSPAMAELVRRARVGLEAGNLPRVVEPGS